jgi:CheY-like chemotaxis protein
MAMTILVVDDSVTMVMSLKTTLVMSGFVVETANHGQAALDKLKSGITAVLNENGNPDGYLPKRRTVLF